MPDGDIDNPFDRAVDDNDPDSIDDIITDGDNDNDDEEYAEYASESESEYDIDWDGVDPDSGPYLPIDIKFCVTSWPRYRYRPVVFHYIPAFGDAPRRSEVFDQEICFDYGPLETGEGMYIFSIEGFQDLMLSRSDIAGHNHGRAWITLYIKLYPHGTVSCELPADPNPDPDPEPETDTITEWNDYEIRDTSANTASSNALTLHNSGTPDSLPGFALYRNNEEVFRDTGVVLDTAPNGKLYYAHFHEDGSNPDIISLDNELTKHTIATNIICLPLYVRTDLTTWGMVLMTGCDEDNPEAPGIFSRLDYHTDTFDELGLVKRDAHRYITDTTRYSVVQGPEDFFIFDGVHAWRDSRWLANYSGSAYDDTIIFSSGYGQCISDTFSDRMLRSCPLGDTGTCHTHGPVLQYSYDENPSILLMVSHHDGAFLGYYNHYRSLSMPDEWCNAQRWDYHRILLHMDNQGNFTGQADQDSAFLPWYITEDGTILADITADNNIRLYRVPGLELLREIPGYINPDTIFPDHRTSGPWHQPFVSTGNGSILYLNKSIYCFSGRCGTLMSHDIESGEEQVIEYSVRAFRLLEDGSLLIGRACTLESCVARSNIATIVEHIPDINSPGTRSTSYLAWDGDCNYNDNNISLLWGYPNPEISGRQEPVLLQIDYRQGRQVFTEIYTGAPSSTIKGIKRYASSMYFLYDPGYGDDRKMSYRIDDPGTLTDYGCGSWRSPVHDFQDFLIHGNIIIPRSHPQTHYDLISKIIAVDAVQQHVYFTDTQVDSGGSAPSQSFRLDIPQMAETLEPLPSCD